MAHSALQQHHHQTTATLLLLLGAAATLAAATTTAAASSSSSTGSTGWLGRLRRRLGLGRGHGHGHGHDDPFHGITREEMKAVRARHMFSKLTLFHGDEEEEEEAPHHDEATPPPPRGPLCLVRGEGAYVYDDRGRRYLDCVNNVAHIGHSHPALQAAAARQLAEINTNTRYHHPGRSRYTKKLLALFPPELDTVFFVNSGSEANDLALALARAYTGREDVIVLDAAYHGHGTSLIDMSAYKHMQHGGGGSSSSTTAASSDFPKPWVHVVPTPDTYRGEHTGPDAAERYAEAVAAALEKASAQGTTKKQNKPKKPKGVAAFFAECVLACGGQVVLPDGYLARVYPLVREAGGVCVADEVQTGFGRSGSHFWAFETQGVVPDIVTLGKPMGNGFPVAAVVCRKAIAESLPHSFFATFGGSNLAMAMGEATLDVVLAEGLQAKARELGAYLEGRFRDELAGRHPLVGDVRGLGMMLGVELVADRVLKTPAPEAAAFVLRRARDLGVHIQVDGIHSNVLKFKPPLAFSGEDADTLVAALDRALGEYAEEQQQQRQAAAAAAGKQQPARRSGAGPGAAAAAFDPPPPHGRK